MKEEYEYYKIPQALPSTLHKKKENSNYNKNKGKKPHILITQIKIADTRKLKKENGKDTKTCEEKYEIKKQKLRNKNKDTWKIKMKIKRRKLKEIESRQKIKEKIEKNDKT